jgi:hypothetical protein
VVVRSAWTRRTVLAALLVLLAADFGGCWGSGSEANDGGTAGQMDGVAAKIQTDLTARADVASATVFYANDITDPRFANAS